MNEAVLGALGALGSILFFGSYAVFIRMPSVLAVNIDPIVYQTYKSFACFATSWLVLLYAPLKFTWWGLVGAGLWAITGIGAITAVQLAGIGPTQSLWSGLSIFVSYIWGSYVFKEPVQNQQLSLVALAVMAAGMVGVGRATSAKTSVLDHLRKLWNASVGLRGAKQAHETFPSVGKEDDESRTLIAAEDTISPKRKYAASDAMYVMETKFSRGLMCAVVVGITNGSFMIPLQYANKDVVGVEYLISFGVGAMTITPLVLAIYFAILSFSGKPCPSFHFSVVAGPALLTGVFWSAGNFCSIYATMYLGMALGWPLVQCQLIVSAMWAAFYYKEATSTKEVTALLASSLLIVAGALLLSKFGCAPLT